MLYNRCTCIYKFGNNTYPLRIRRRSNLGHIFSGKKCVLWAWKYDNWLEIALYLLLPLNTTITELCTLTCTNVQFRAERWNVMEVLKTVVFLTGSELATSSLKVPICCPIYCRNSRDLI